MAVTMPFRPFVLLALVALLACAGRSCARTDLAYKPTGLLVFVAPVPDSMHWRWEWLDLATGATGELGYEGSGTLTYENDRTGLWMTWATRTRKDRDFGALHVARDGRGVAARFTQALAVSVSPDGTHAVKTRNYPGSFEDELVISRVTPRGFTPGDGLGVKLRSSTVFGWFDNRTVLVWAEDFGLLRVSPGKRPDKIRVVEDCWEGSTSHDMRWYACSSPSDDEHQVLRIASLHDRQARERFIAIGAGESSYCRFAPGDRTIACMVGDPYVGEVRVVAVDVATGTVTELSASAGPAMTFSPDGQHVMVFEDEMTIVRIDGKGPRIRLGKKGAPVAWIR